MKLSKLANMTVELSAVAQGRIKADLIIKNIKLVNVNTHEIQDGMDIAIYKGRIAYVGSADHSAGENTVIVQGGGKYACPGFMDGHIHVESSMMTVGSYAETVIPSGTTTIYADPHEIANVLGAKGIELMLEDGATTPFRFYVAVPSCVPAVAAFEDGGAVIMPDDIRKFMSRDDVCGLGEMMNFPGILYGDKLMHEEVQITLEHGKTVTGHYSMPETDRGLNAYIASGIRCCHESVRKEDALAKMRLGMYAQIREGSAWHDLKECIKAITETNINTRFATLVSDDTHPHTLLAHGHLNHIVRRAVEEGVNPVTAIEMVTINVAECFGMAKDLGSISPGKCADILLLDDLAEVKVNEVFINGELVAKGGVLIKQFDKFVFPASAKKTMNLKELKETDFVIKAPAGAKDSVDTRVIEVIEAKVGTYNRRLPLKVVGGNVMADGKRSILKVAVIERHKATGTMGKGFVKGFHIEGGAVGSTVAHDAHNLQVVGDNDRDMAVAANALIKCGGGMVAVKNGVVTALLELPVAGLMSEEPVKTIAAKVDALDKAWKALGCDMVSPFMTMALIPLSVLPELRLTNRGLVDTVNFKMTDLFEE